MVMIESPGSSKSRDAMSGAFGQAGTALGEGGESIEEVDAVFGGGGEIAADGAELLGP